MGGKKYSGYITKCGVPIRFCVDSTYAWEVDSFDGNWDDEKTPIRSIAASSMEWHEKNELIFTSCRVPCEAMVDAHEYVYKGEVRSWGHCRVEKSDTFDGSYREAVGDNNIQYRSWKFQRYLTTGVEYCGCVSEGVNGKPNIDYHTDNCRVFQPHGCMNETCFITGKKRDLALVNIFADIKYTAGEGLFEHEVIQKRIKLWGPFPKDIADRKLKEKLTEYDKNLNRWRYEHGRKLNGLIPTAVYISKRGTRRDLKQDLADAAEGYEVIHDSDIKKAAAAKKRERKLKRQDYKRRKLQRSIINKWITLLQDPDTSEHMVDYAKRELSKRGINYEAIIIRQQAQQLDLFNEL